MNAPFLYASFLHFLKKIHTLISEGKVDTFSAYGYFGHMTPKKELFLTFSHFVVECTLGFIFKIKSIFFHLNDFIWDNICLIIIFYITQY